MKNNKISTDVFCKPTDAQQYLDMKSCYPRHVKQGIPYELTHRVRKICNLYEAFRKRLSELSVDFVKRSFKVRMVHSQFRRAKVKSKETLLNQENGNDNGRGVLVVNFHPVLSKINSIIDSLWPLLQASESMKVFCAKPMVAYRRPRNLKDELVRAWVKKQGEEVCIRGMRISGRTRCQICRYVEERDIFGLGNRMYDIYYAFESDSEAVIYLIICRKCQKIYVGSTVTSSRKCFNNHRSSLNRYGPIWVGTKGYTRRAFICTFL